MLVGQSTVLTADVVQNTFIVVQEVAADDLDVPTFLRRQASKA